MRTWPGRAFLYLVAALLVTPLLGAVIAPETRLVSAEEMRPFAPAPGWPLPRWSAWPRAADAWLRDHFGLRTIMLEAQSGIVRTALNSRNSPEVFEGTDGRLFFRGENASRRSAGLLLRADALTATADLIAAMRDRLEAQGIAFVYAPVPNAQTVETGSLPSWARNPGRPTEYDLLLDLLGARRVTAVDLRPALRAAGPGVYLKYDSHWNARGMLAAFNETAGRAGHGDWLLEPAAVLGSRTLRGGDLARLLGFAGRVSAEEPAAVAPEVPGEQLGPVPGAAFRMDSGRPGRSVLILGDSFTEHFFPGLALARAGRVAWVASLHCGFDWGWIGLIRPDEVWWLQAERHMPCFTARPRNMPP